MEIAEDIDIAIFFELIHLRSFYQEESDTIFILFWSSNIDLIMTNIEITTRDDLLTRSFELIDIVEKMFVKF